MEGAIGRRFLCFARNGRRPDLRLECKRQNFRVRSDAPKLQTPCPKSTRRRSLRIARNLRQPHLPPRRPTRQERKHPPGISLLPRKLTDSPKGINDIVRSSRPQVGELCPD